MYITSFVAASNRWQFFFKISGLDYSQQIMTTTLPNQLNSCARQKSPRSWDDIGVTFLFKKYITYGFLISLDTLSNRRP